MGITPIWPEATVRDAQGASANGPSSARMTSAKLMASAGAASI